jgi:hypothetical protein
MLKTKFAVIALAIFTLFGVTGQVVYGAEPQNQLIVVLLDRHAIVESQNNKNLTESFLGLLSMLRDGDQIILATADDGAMRGPEIAGSAEYKLIHRNTLIKLANSSGAPEADMVEALVTNFEMLDIEQAAPGSTVYVVTGGESEEPLGETSERLSLSAVLQRFEAKGWPVVGVSLPGASPYASELFSLISSETGEQTYPLSVPEGFKAFTDHMLSADAKGHLAQLGQGTLAPNEMLSSTLDIAPASIETTVIFFKERPTGSLRLKNPSGFEASEGDRALSQVIETPFIVMWKLVEPVPGQWSVDMQGVEGKISAWHYSANKLGLGFLTPSAIPLGQTVPLVAYITDGSERVTMTDVEVRARVSGPNGTTITYSLNDNGELGDSIAGDGFYSTSITPLATQGDYNVDLELFWPQFNNFITSQKTFTTQPFPSITMDVLEAGVLEIGERTKVATAEVHVDGQPFAIPLEQLTASLTTNVEDSGNIEVVPQKLINQGRAWAFDIYYTATGQDQHTILMRLDMDYAGREYQFSTETLVLSSLIPPVPPEPFVQITQAPAPAPAPLLGPTMPRELLAIPAVLVLALIAFGVYIITRTRPYGYLYNDRGELLVNFKTLPRKFAPTFMSRDKVEGNELGVGELGGVSFSFSRGKVDIRSSSTDPSVRINNRPLVEGEEAILHNETWIGTQGKLFSFLLSPMARAQPSTGDD